MGVVVGAGAPPYSASLPQNIRVSEFYFQPDRFLNSPLAQQNYRSSNYTHVVRDVLDAAITVLVQLVSKMTTTALLVTA